MTKNQKSYYIDNQLDNISLHDCPIHGIFYNEHHNQFLLDIDFITKWVFNDGIYNFIISRSTLVFSHVLDVSINLDFRHVGKILAPEIDQLKHVKEVNQHNIEFSKFIIESHHGTIEIYADKVELFLRTGPTLLKEDSILKFRKQPSFELIRYDRR